MDVLERRLVAFLLCSLYLIKQNETVNTNIAKKEDPMKATHCIPFQEKLPNVTVCREIMKNYNVALSEIYLKEDKAGVILLEAIIKVYRNSGKMVELAKNMLKSYMDAHCQKDHAALYRKLEAVFINVDMSDFASCVEQVMWFICHLTFPVCKFDKIRKMWRKIPICRSSCLSYRKVPSCKRIMLDIHVYFDLKRYCGDTGYLDSLFCFDQQNVTTTDCLTNFPTPLTNRGTTVKNSANNHHDLNKQQQVIISATLPCIIVPAALLISYVIIKQQRKWLKNQQSLMNDQIEAYSASPLATDNIIYHPDNEELS